MTLPQQALASAWLQMRLHELPLEQEWEKTASDGGYFDNCSPITSISLQLELLYQAPAHLFPYLNAHTLECTEE